MRMFTRKMLMLAIALTVPFTAGAEEAGNPMAGDTLSADAYVVDAFDAAHKGAEIRFKYLPGNIYKIYTQEGFVTEICLEENEALKYIGGGDTTRWRIDSSISGYAGRQRVHVFLKPTERGINTNLIINTDKRSYQLLAVSGSFFNPKVSWTYPQVGLNVSNSLLGRKTQDILDPLSLDFNFKISDRSLEWAPKKIFRSGSKTYLKMKQDIENTQLPAFFVIDDEGKKVLTSYRFKNGYYVIDHLFTKAELLLGNKLVKISYKR